MTSEDVERDVRREVADFWNGAGAFMDVGIPDERQAVTRFLERNHVVRIPEEGELKVTIEGIKILVNGEVYGDLADIFSWQETVDVFAKHIEMDAHKLRKSILHHEKARAVLAFLTQEQEARKAKELEGEQRRKVRADQLAQEFYGEPRADHLSLITQRVLARLVEAEDELAARS